MDGNVIRVIARLRAVGADPKNKELIKFSWCAYARMGIGYVASTSDIFGQEGSRRIGGRVRPSWRAEPGAHGAWSYDLHCAGNCHNLFPVLEIVLLLTECKLLQQNPQCGQCPIRGLCLAYEESRTTESSTRSGGDLKIENECTICDRSRLSEWDNTTREVICRASMILV